MAAWAFARMTAAGRPVPQLGALRCVSDADGWCHCWQVREELREFASGVTGVPHFIINGKYHLSGAQDPETFAQVLAKV